MDYLKKIFENIWINGKVPFAICRNDKKYIINKLSNLEEKNTVNCEVKVKGNKMNLKVLKKDENSLSLLKYFIETKTNDLNITKEESFKKILDGEIVHHDILDEFIKENRYLICIRLDSNKLETLEILNESYKKEKVISTICNDYVVMLASLADIEEHIKSIWELIWSNLYCKCYISYESIKNLDCINMCFSKLKYNIYLGSRYKPYNFICMEKDLILEKILDNVSNDIKKEIFDEFNRYFKDLDLDMDMVKTVETFFNSNLNITEVSRKLYLHRNSVIYRLDKIYKFTGYDIRKFNEAMMFKIKFSIWKDMKSIL